MINYPKETLIYNNNTPFNLNSLSTEVKSKIDKIARVNPTTKQTHQIWSPNAGILQFTALTCGGIYNIESNTVGYDISNDLIEHNPILCGGTISLVTSVNTRTGAVTIDKADVGLDNVDNTSDTNKPISTAVQNALDVKAPLNSPSFTGTVTGISKGMIGLGNVDNTSDIDKPISNSTQNALNAKSNLNHTHEINNIDNLQTLLDSKQPLGNYASLVNGTIPVSQLPSYVDEILEYATRSVFPSTGLSNKIYVDVSTNKVYRWGGSIYVDINASAGTTDNVAEGLVNLYFTNSRASAAAPVQTVNGKVGTVTLNKTDIGLSNVDNTSDANKPISSATQTALDAKAPLANPSFTGTVSGITKSMVGLGNVDNTSDANKPISNATQTALNNKENSIVAGTSSQYYRGDKSWQTLDKTSVGLSNVDNTSDVNKPISTAVQNALDQKTSINTYLEASGRLSLSNNNPVTTSDILAATTLYYSRYNGSTIVLYDTSIGSSKVYNIPLNGISLSLTGLAADNNYDIFLYNNNGTLALEAVAWLNNNTRAIDITRLNGLIYVMSGSTSNRNKRYVGTIRTTNVAGQCEDSEKRRFVYNYHNRLNKTLSASLTANHSYASNTVWRPFNNDTTVGATRVEFVNGVVEDNINYTVNSQVINGYLGVGFNTSNNSSGPVILITQAFLHASATHTVINPLGFNYLQAVELSVANSIGIGSYPDIMRITGTVRL